MKWEAGPGGKEAADLSPDVFGATVLRGCMSLSEGDVGAEAARRG